MDWPRREKSSCTLLCHQGRKAKNDEKREFLAKQEIDLWLSYVDRRSTQLPTKLQITPTIEEELKDIWPRFTDRQTQRVPLSKMLDLHHEYGKKYRVRVPLDPKNLAQMVHPHYGYLTSLPVRPRAES